MKTICILWALLVCATTALGEAPQQWELLKLPNGTEYTKAVLLAVEDDGIKISHANGVARIPHEKLPAELQERFAFDPERARLARAEREAAERSASRMEAARKKHIAKIDLGSVDYGKIKFEIVNIKVVRIEPDGIICYRYQPGGAAGETARAVNSLVDKPNRLRGPQQETTAIASPTGALWYLQGCKEKCAEGDVLVGIAGRYGEKLWQGRTLQRWIAKPD